MTTTTAATVAETAAAAALPRVVSSEGAFVACGAFGGPRPTSPACRVLEELPAVRCRLFIDGAGLGINDRDAGVAVEHHRAPPSAPRRAEEDDRGNDGAASA